MDATDVSRGTSVRRLIHGRRWLRTYRRTYSTPSRGMSAQHISESVGGWLREAGIKRGRHDGIGAHALRRTCATELLQRGTIRQVQAVLRHASLTSTERYLRRSEAEELRALVDPA